VTAHGRGQAVSKMYELSGPLHSFECSIVRIQSLETRLVSLKRGHEQITDEPGVWRRFKPVRVNQGIILARGIQRIAGIELEARIDTRDFPIEVIAKLVCRALEVPLHLLALAVTDFALPVILQISEHR